MTDDEVAAFLASQRTATMATTGRDGDIHLVAMWYATIPADPNTAGTVGATTVPEIWFETKAKSQKAVNLRRDPRLSASIEAGLTYDELRGVAISGYGEIHDDPETCLRVGIGVWERYNGPYSDDLRPAVEAMMNKRVAVRLVPERIRSWDHRKLGLPAMPLGGSTA